MFKGNGVKTQENCDEMWRWLQEKGVNSHRSGIVNAIAEKLNTMMPGVFDASELESKE